MNLLYVTLTTREKLGAAGVFALYLLVLSLCPVNQQFFLLIPVLLGLSIWIFRRFLLESLQIPLVAPGQILLKAVLATLISQLSVLLTNDLIYYFLPRYFLYTDLGPMFYMASWEWLLPLNREIPVLTMIVLVICLPIAEELLFRGFLFGPLYRRSPLAGFLLTLVVYTLIRMLPVLDMDTPYVCIYALQYIPMTIYLSWIYVRADTIAAPIAAHMLINALKLYTLRSYYA